MGNSHTKDLEIDYLKTQNRLLLSNNPDNALSVRCQTQNVKTERTYENLVFSGGAIKCIAHLGAMEKLEELGILARTKQVACSSVGSIFGALWSVGYSVEEMQKIIMDLDTSSLIETKRGLVTGFYETSVTHGASAGGYLVDFLGELIKRQTGDSDYTLGQLWNDKGINLVLSGTDLSQKRTIYLWHNSNADMPIRHAVRISMSIPYVYQPIIYRGHFIVDGGLLHSHLETVFDGEFPGDPLSLFKMTQPNPHTLALDIVGAMSYNDSTSQDITSPEGYGTALLDSLYSTSVVTAGRGMRTINIPTPGYPLSKFDLVPVEKQLLLDLGYRTCDKFFE